MNRRLTTIVACAFLSAISLRPNAQAQGQPASRLAGDDPAGLADQVDLAAFGQLAVHTEGRVKSFDSFAAASMRFVTGPRKINGRSPSFTYLDLMLRPQGYESEDIIYVKNKLIRAEIVRALRDDDGHQHEQAVDRDRLARFMKMGLISPQLLSDHRVRDILQELGTDLIKTARYVDAIRTALVVREPARLRHELRVIAPPGGGKDDQWYTLDELVMTAEQNPELLKIPEDLRRQLAEQWLALTGAWRRADADAVNDAAAELAQLLPTINADPAVYPAAGKLAWESWYFQNKNLTWVWLIYALSLVPLLLFVVFRWNSARWVGLVLFFVAFGFHTFAIMLRWYVAGRWPNSNMFEAVTTAAWFGGCFAVLFELFAQRSPVRGLIALGSAAASMVALMCAHFMPLSLDPNIGNMMPVLNDLWLYIHTNVIIFSYALVFMAAISSVLYLLFRLGKLITGRGGIDDFARVGGAGSLIMTTPQGGSYLARAKTTAPQVLDGTTMILLELSFIMLWAGIVMGAIWADHSWGRPWGWDPKEVFALNTFIIFAVLIHTRLKARDKGLWTALLAIVGCAVMLFNWIIINFTIAGLHSYA